MAFNANMYNGPIPGEGLTRPVGGAPYQNPPQHVDLDQFLESVWAKLSVEKNAVSLYGLLKIGMPAEALARTILFKAFSEGSTTVDVALLALPTVIRQVVAIGHLLGVKNIKVKNPNINQKRYLAQLGRLMDSVEATPDPVQSPQAAPSKATPFSGLGA